LLTIFRVLSISHLVSFFLSIEKESGCQRSNIVIIHLTDFFQRRKTFDWYNTWKEKSINYSICSSYQQKYKKKNLVFNKSMIIIQSVYHMDESVYKLPTSLKRKQLQKHSIIAMKTSVSIVITCRMGFY